MNLALDSKKVMFEIYRDPNFDRTYRVVYFTELDEHDKEEGIGGAMRGEHVFDGFILHRQRQEAKERIARLIERMNRGESFSAAEIEDELRPFMT